MAVESSKLPYLQLRLVPQMTRVRFYALIDHFQSAEAVFGATAKEIAALRGFDEQLAREILEAPRAISCEKELELIERYGVRLVTLEDDDYPENLRQSSFAPPLLYVRGSLTSEDRYALAVIGSRRATQYGRAIAQEFSGQLARWGLTVVSGFARGIDSEAHEAALRAGGRTIGVLGNGLAVCYPPENRALEKRILENGALVSEYPMETPPDRFNFPERNHLIATLSLGTLVVEAAEKSGALITAKEALEENRFVFAVPGDITRQNSRGTNALIQQGAKLVQSASDILAEMRHVLRGYLREDFVANADGSKGHPNGREAAPVNRSTGEHSNHTTNLSSEEAEVLSLLREEPLYFDVLLSKLDPERFNVQRLASVLLSLEMKQAIRQMPGKLYMVLR
ncbi:MAG: DNA-protecting protein DprA [Candidatus Hydrogenedentota bacterium]|jgi:DNA processing protein|uniref:Rossmann fold nucleotide-binding protein Smf n=1 Tax=Sumerlaea chitinivorans TaxID=2250252 RepID=A0A2Z4Y1L9_SUMC1|nr:Rossmann fold nucleotide-binding protein Smf [Candidatus Sumerlaea chitinivorans]RMH29260.1 MAG: DNA-protecting protein DprA [Candidatus Hydrogenedentota bacterium]GIX44869.1 MAG: DNA polymerase [Candidatus Sumerlaea sp.]